MFPSSELVLFNFNSKLVDKILSCVIIINICGLFASRNGRKSIKPGHFRNSMTKEGKSGRSWKSYTNHTPKLRNPSSDRAQKFI